MLEIVELLAENAHESWALNRMTNGWSFGPERRDEIRQSPWLIPYSQLPESVKVLDREVVLGTVRALISLGFTIEKPGS